MALVFQYGSNTSSKRLNAPERLDGAAESKGLVYTQDLFELDFTHYSCCNKCATADLLLDGSRQIYGVLYDIPEHRIFRRSKRGLKTLDEIEGECSAYCRTKIIVVPAHEPNSPCKVITYLVKTRSEEPIETTARYVEHIISGLREHNAPEEYIDYVKERSVNNNPDIAQDIENM